MTPSKCELAEKLSELLDNKASASKSPEFFLNRLREHFNEEPAKFPIVQGNFDSFQHPCVHVAIGHYLANVQRSAEVLGLSTESRSIPSLSNLLFQGPNNLIKEGPVMYQSIQLSNNETLSCVQRGLFLVSDGEERFAFLFFKDIESVSLHVIAKQKDVAERFLRELRELVKQYSVYRGHVLSLKSNFEMDLQVCFQQLPFITRDKVILPDLLLDRIERQTIRSVESSDRLSAAGIHLKRGLLLHGAPGTGKSLTVMYLISRLGKRTTILLNGFNIELIGQACKIARMLQPSTIVIEDADLVAEERSRKCFNPLLFELLNEMDGIGDDADTLFLLTTNQPEILEPALSSRPGRIDQAIKIPLPDESCRRRLFSLYGKGLLTEINNMQKYIDQTKGASAAFIRELLRKAALLSSEESPEMLIEEHHLDQALMELLSYGGHLTKSILGFQSQSYPPTP